MNNYLVKIYYLGEVITTIVKDKISLINLIQLIVNSNCYKLMSVNTVNYEPVEDVISNLKQEVKPKNLTYGKEGGK